MLQHLKNLFKGKTEPELPAPDPDYSELIRKIEETEENQKLHPGKKIHSLEYDLFEIRIDRDITENYRITVFQGNERIYSFTVFAEKGENEKLKKAFKQVIGFLKGDRSIAKLPDSKLLKGFYFGNR